ncbi:hypothetical protein ACWIGX_21130 [Streptomyces nigrescens]
MAMPTSELSPEEQHLLRAAAERGDVFARFRLGKGLLDRGNREEAKRWLVPLAEAGHGEAVRALAWSASRLARTDSAYEAEAEHWLRREARVSQDRDVLVAMAVEMRGWASGRVAEAEQLVAGLAQEGSARAAGQLAFWDEERDPAAAVQWYRLAMELGDKSAWSFLGECLSAQGRYAEAKAVYRPYADAGDSFARRKLQEVVRAQGESGTAPEPEQSELEFRVGGLPDAVATAVITAAVLPFLQAVATQAAGDAYAKSRALINRILHREGSDDPDPCQGPALHLVHDPQTGTRLELRGGELSDEALHMLTLADLDALSAPDRQGRTVTVYWDREVGLWRRRVQ